MTKTCKSRLEDTVESCFDENVAWAIALLLEGNEAKSARGSK